MTKRRGERRRRKRDDVPYLAGIGLADYFVLEFVLAPRYGVAIAILLWFVMLMVWVLFIMPTRCDFDVGGRGCRWPVYGKLNGCHFHGPEKRDAMWGALRMRNPGQFVRIRWTSVPHGGRTVGPSNPANDPNGVDTTASRARQGAFNMSMLAFTATGAIAAVLALFIQK